ncbi:acetyl-CoA C-acetyltransferase [Streptomyces sp. SRF1]|uniref:acetyl-CoA C-acetyltransferase n=1 Tax=Streptomyces sp. SRF1 TaxID=1549642 RepID=UPI0025AFCD14|nr:acetyl-CoA C-acetyltransferase [Streptomyces sp. SRF1]MDN3059002.1 acetyl-CoA C-acetyltransferase [Streptomyces sp. SRF1]
MTEAYLVDGVRSAVGRRNGGLADVHTADLGASVLAALVDRVGIDPSRIDDVIFGCLDPVGMQAGNIARTSWLTAGLPETVPGVTIDRQCGSSQQAVHFAAQAVMSGTQQLVVAGGVQTMSRVPISASWSTETVSDPFSGSIGWNKRYGGEEINQIRAADLIAERWDISRERMEEFALESHRRAIDAADSGRFSAQIVPVAGVTRDEGPRRDSTAETLAGLRLLRDGGRLTAAVASQISDGASAILVASQEAIDRYGLTPRARVHQLTVRGDDPVLMLTGPISATRHALDACGLSIDDIDLFEINEAFASVVLAWLDELGADPARLNVNGGAIALGHPLGASGGRIMIDLLNELEHRAARFGLQSMCEGGGLANVTIIERI